VTTRGPTGRSDVPEEITRRARELVEPYLAGDGVVGAYLSGSTVYPGTSDEQSDLDLYVVLEDAAFERLPARRRRQVIIDRGPPRRKAADLVCMSVRELAEARDSTNDHVHWCAGFARVLHDPREAIGPLMAQIAALPENVALARLKLHFLELHYCANKADRARAGGNDLNVATMVVHGALAALKVLALEHGSWPIILHWTAQGLAALAVPGEVVEVVRRALLHPAEPLEPVLAVVSSSLASNGHRFHQHILSLDEWRWSAEGRATVEQWGAGVL